VPVLGLVENPWFLLLPECGHVAPISLVMARARDRGGTAWGRRSSSWGDPAVLIFAWPRDAGTPIARVAPESDADKGYGVLAARGVGTS